MQWHWCRPKPVKSTNKKEKTVPNEHSNRVNHINCVNVYIYNCIIIFSNERNAKVNGCVGGPGLDLVLSLSNNKAKICAYESNPFYLPPD